MPIDAKTRWPFTARIHSSTASAYVCVCCVLCVIQVAIIRCALLIYGERIKMFTCFFHSGFLPIQNGSARLASFEFYRPHGMVHGCQTAHQNNSIFSNLFRRVPTARSERNCAKFENCLSTAGVANVPLRPPITIIAIAAKAAKQMQSSQIS